ncbi:hypothetical protein F183_A36560 [Bryobacterales bacterium F-183]|nr:hypothetical protein F183_A36560 [Bryobacterales bacterium F-183]
MRYLLLFCLGVAAFATDRESYVQVTMERKDGNEWKSLDPRTVLNAADRIRFKFEANYTGFLYVYDKASDGSTERLFPGSGADNRIEAGKAYIVPTDGSFVIDGPPGFDVTYWILSPEPLARIPMFDDAPKVANLPSTIVPRCKEGLVARGSSGCLDDRAGAQQTKDASKIVPKAESTLRARNIKVEKAGETRIAAPSSKSAPLIYEFRVAHK